MARTKLLTIPINEDERKLFQQLAQRDSRTVSDAVRNLVRQSLAERPAPAQQRQERAA